MSERNVRSDLFPGPVRPSLSLSLIEKTCSILVDQSYYHAPYLGRSKDVLDFTAQNLLEKKSVRRFVEVFSSNPKKKKRKKQYFRQKATTFRRQKLFFQRNFLKSYRVRCVKQREERPRRDIVILSNISKHNGLHVGALLRHYFRCVIRL